MNGVYTPENNYKVGITYNLKRNVANCPIDMEAEYDSFETIISIKDALEHYGCEVDLYDANDLIFEKLSKKRPDIVFNIAEGRGGRGREAQIPSLLGYYNIPFTGSDETTLCISLDKTLAKSLVQNAGIKTPKFQLFKTESDEIDEFCYPVILKPNAEGSSKGIKGITIAEDKHQLKSLLINKMSEYQQPIIAEEYVHGREFTVGIVGNGNSLKVFRPMEIIIRNNSLNDGYNVYSYEVKCNYQDHVIYNCPANISNELEKKFIDVSSKIYNILDCKDFARIDYMLDKNNNIYFLEINPLPGLASQYSDLPIMASLNGINYNELVISILNSGLSRYNMKTIV